MRWGIFAIIFGLQFSAHAITADQSLGNTVKNLMSIVKISDQNSRVQQMCQLIRTSVDLSTISGVLLGSNFSTMDRDRAGINRFNTLMPSIIVSDFYSLVVNNGGVGYQIDPTPLPKGSGRVGYRTTIGSSQIVITVSKSNLKILDVEWNNMSLVNTKRDYYQQELQRFWDTDNFHSMPVTDLDNELINSSSLIRCN